MVEARVGNKEYSIESDGIDKEVFEKISLSVEDALQAFGQKASGGLFKTPGTAVAHANAAKGTGKTNKGCIGTIVGMFVFLGSACFMSSPGFLFGGSSTNCRTVTPTTTILTGTPKPIAFNQDRPSVTITNLPNPTPTSYQDCTSSSTRNTGGRSYFGGGSGGSGGK